MSIGLTATRAYLAAMEEGLALLLAAVPEGERRDILAQPYVDEIERTRAEIAQLESPNPSSTSQPPRTVKP